MSQLRAMSQLRMPFPTLWTVAVLTVYRAGVARSDTVEDMLNSWLDKVLASATISVKPQKIVRIEDENVQKVFPRDRFYGFYFATWPIAPRLPRELSSETLVRIRRAETV